jgi:hypothetical protein
MYRQYMLHFVKIHESKLACLLYTAVSMSTKTNIKHKELPVFEKMEFIKNMEAQPRDVHEGCKITWHANVDTK